MGRRGLAVQLPDSLSFGSISLPYSAPPAELFPFVHPGGCSGCYSGRPAGEEGIRASSSRLLQPSFCYTQSHGGGGAVIDLSRLNHAVNVSHFHMETTQSVFQSLRPGDWMVSLDLQDAYLQVPVHPSSRCYLQFCVGNSVLQFRALCFGLSTAPQTFTRVMGPDLLDHALLHLQDPAVFG